MRDYWIFLVNHSGQDNWRQRDGSPLEKKSVLTRAARSHLLTQPAGGSQIQPFLSFHLRPGPGPSLPVHLESYNRLPSEVPASSRPSRWAQRPQPALPSTALRPFTTFSWANAWPQLTELLTMVFRPPMIWPPSQASFPVSPFCLLFPIYQSILSINH